MVPSLILIAPSQSPIPSEMFSVVFDNHKRKLPPAGLARGKSAIRIGEGRKAQPLRACYERLQIDPIRKGGCLCSLSSRSRDARSRGTVS